MDAHEYKIDTEDKVRKIIDLFVVTPLIIGAFVFLTQFLISAGLRVDTQLLSIDMGYLVMLSPLLLLLIVAWAYYIYVLPSFLISDGSIGPDGFVLPVDGKWISIAPGSQRTIVKRIRYNDVSEIMVENERKSSFYRREDPNRIRIDHLITNGSYVRIMTRNVSFVCRGKRMTDERMVAFLRRIARISYNESMRRKAPERP
jgi:hypothetical protein